MEPEKIARLEPGPKELVLALGRDQPFDEMVKVLEKALTFEEFPGVSGCRPCFSGLDRFTIASRILQP